MPLKREITANERELGRYKSQHDSLLQQVQSIDEMFGWGMHGAIQDILRNRKGDFASAIEKNLEKSQTKLEKSIDIIENLRG